MNTSFWFYQLGGPDSIEQAHGCWVYANGMDITNTEDTLEWLTDMMLFEEWVIAFENEQ